MTRSSLLTAAVAAAAVFASACAHAPRKSAGASNPASMASQAEPSLRDAAMITVPQLQNVYFGFNSAHLSEAARKTLASNAAWLKEHPEVRVQVAGNCDQRGTVEFNLALGQRRATAVRDYYRMMGVQASRVATISYGKERPLCADSNEACWQRNRRSETRAAVSQNVSSATLPPATR